MSNSIIFTLTCHIKLVINEKSSSNLTPIAVLIGLFMASRPSIIACGIRMAAVAMAMKFMAGPALMAAASLSLGLRGKLLRVAIVQVSQLFLSFLINFNMH